MKMYVVQSRFLFALAKLIFYAHEAGYDVTLGRGLEDKESNARHGGVPNGLHLNALAQDLNFFLKGVWLTKTEQLQIFGDYWKAQGPEFCWGGDLIVNGNPKPDGNHFSFSIGGRK